MAAAETPANDFHPIPGKPVILVVDDEALVRSFLQVALERYGFAVWPVASGHEAIELYRRQGRHVALVLLDVCMGGLDGPQTLTALQRINPNIRCCFMSGDTGKYAEKDLLHMGAGRVFNKPFQLADLADFLQHFAATAEFKESPPQYPPPYIPAPERRLTPRSPCGPISILISNGQASKTLEGTVTDYSAGGLGLTIFQPVEEGTVLEVCTIPNGCQSPSRVQVQVKHCRLRESHWVVGGQFVEECPDEVVRLFG